MARRAGKESLRSEQCQQAGGPVGPGRSLFNVSASAKLVARTSGERWTVEELERWVSDGGPHERGEVTPRERHRKVGEENRGRDAPAPRAERTAVKSAQSHNSRAIRTLRSRSTASARRRGGPYGRDEVLRLILPHGNAALTAKGVVDI